MTSRGFKGSLPSLMRGIAYTSWRAYRGRSRELATPKRTFLPCRRAHGGVGLVFLEAMAFAKPIVGAAIRGTTDLIEHRANGLSVSPHDKEALVQALRLLLHNNSLRSDLGRRGAEIVQEKYRFEVFQSQLLRFVEESDLDS
jgi:glycosyltransferase involved in cell wall biosynthesis